MNNAREFFSQEIFIIYSIELYLCGHPFEQLLTLITMAGCTSKSYKYLGELYNYEKYGLSQISLIEGSNMKQSFVDNILEYCMPESVTIISFHFMFL